MMFRRAVLGLLLFPLFAFASCEVERGETPDLRFEFREDQVFRMEFDLDCDVSFSGGGRHEGYEFSFGQGLLLKVTDRKQGSSTDFEVNSDWVKMGFKVKGYSYDFDSRKDNKSSDPFDEYMNSVMRPLAEAEGLVRLSDQGYVARVEGWGKALDGALRRARKPKELEDLDFYDMLQFFDDHFIRLQMDWIFGYFPGKPRAVGSSYKINRYPDDRDFPAQTERCRFLSYEDGVARFRFSSNIIETKSGGMFPFYMIERTGILDGGMNRELTIRRDSMEADCTQQLDIKGPIEVNSGVPETFSGLKEVDIDMSLTGNVTFRQVPTRKEKAATNAERPDP